MKTAYFDCYSGISGNMIIGAFLDAGLPPDYLESELAKLGLSQEYHLHLKRVSKLGIGACYFDVRLHHQHHAHHHHDHDQKRGLREILALINNSDLADPVKIMAEKIFRRLAEAEAKVHQCSLEDVHFHEVGAVDAIVDVVGAAIAVHCLGITKVLASPLHVGCGTVRCAHGIMPVPAPATAELLKGVPIYSTGIQGELVTPTGAAIITTLAESFSLLPAMRIEKIAYGAGTWDLPISNTLRLYLGDLTESLPEQDTVTMIEANIDDMNPELYSHVLDKLFQAGALDAFLTPIYMKKNRPGIILSVLSNLPEPGPLLDLIFKETTTLGVRMYPVRRQKLEKSHFTVQTQHGPVRVKVGKSRDQIRNLAPEYEDCKALAENSGSPLKEIYQEALSLAYSALRKETGK